MVMARCSGPASHQRSSLSCLAMRGGTMLLSNVSEMRASSSA